MHFQVVSLYEGRREVTFLESIVNDQVYSAARILWVLPHTSTK